MPSSSPGSGGRVSRRRWAPVLWVALALGLILAFSWTRSGPARESAARFRTASVQRRNVVATVEVTGHLAARDRRVVMAGRRGRLAEVTVEPGDRVAAGEVLARLEPGTSELVVRRRRAAVRAAEGRLAEAAAQLDQLQKALERTRALRGRNQTSEAAVEEAIAAEASARASMQVARAELSDARESLNEAEREARETEVVAPSAGVVLTVPEERGVPVSPDGPRLFELAAPLESLRLVAEVGEADIARLEVGQSGEFETTAFPGDWFPARVESIGVLGRRDEGVATYTVELDAPNPDGRLLPGMTAAVRFEVGRAEEALVVREAALRFTPDGAPDAPPRSRVFVRTDPGALVAVSVTTGVSDGAYTEIVPAQPDGLTEGDPVAIGYGEGAEEGAETNISLGGGS